MEVVKGEDGSIHCKSCLPPTISYLLRTCDGTLAVRALCDVTAEGLCSSRVVLCVRNTLLDLLQLSHTPSAEQDIAALRGECLRYGSVWGGKGVRKRVY